MSVPELFALLGDPVEGNPTEAMIEAAFRELGLNWRYVSVRVDAQGLPAALVGLAAMRFRGVHITIPHKEAALRLVDALTPIAAAAGAVNCLVRTDTGWLGDNTDGAGLVRALASRVTVPRPAVALLGAGGAARAIAAQLAIDGASEIRIYNRDVVRAEGVAVMVRGLGVSASAHEWPAAPLALDADLVVNATSIGMAGNPWVAQPIDWSALEATCVVADAVIGDDTAFVVAARDAGLTVVTGLDMLVEQAALSLLLWAGREPDRSAIRAAAVTVLA